MYPFERFTERAKKTLTLAQEEAERSCHSYIGTEHLLLGILRNREGLGSRVLEPLGVRIDVVRQAIESVLGSSHTVVIQQLIPTSRVKKVIELAFEEAQRMGHQYVGTEHLLLGLMFEGEGIAAHVLADLGVTLPKVRDEIARQLKDSGTGEPTTALHPGPSVPPPLEHPAPVRPTVAGPSAVSDLESLETLLGRLPIAGLLRARGLDVETLVDRLRNPPGEVLNLRLHLAAINHELNKAVADEDYDRAAQVQRARGELAARLRKAEQDWLDELVR